MTAIQISFAFSEEKGKSCNNDVCIIHTINSITLSSSSSINTKIPHS